jgi:DNA-binding GntR family transcriptional regulator
VSARRSPTRPRAPRHSVVESPNGDAGTTLVKALSLHSRVVDQMQQMIIEGTLAPGARLNERLLCAHFGVSRTPLREAYRMLAARGLVNLLPNRGAVVAQLSPDDVADHFELISDLEALSGELACKRITDEEVNEIQALHFEMLACHARRDLPGYYRLNQLIHDSIVSAARNKVLREVYEAVNSRVKALRLRSNIQRDHWDAAVREHGAMIEALRARDGKQLAAVLRHHVRAKGETVLVSLRTPGPAAEPAQ